MNRDELKRIIEKGLALIAPEADFEELPEAVSIREELDIDSFDFLNFLIGLNDELGIDIPESDYEKLITMDDLINYLEQRSA